MAAAAAARGGQAKRRIGVGFIGLGNALVDAAPALRRAEGRAHGGAHRAHACATPPMRPRSSWRARKAPFPLFDAARYLEAAPSHAPAARRCSEAIRAHGIRNCHLLSIAPTGTVSLAFADNASNGIEPAFSWTYQRKKRKPDDTSAPTRCRTMPGACTGACSATHADGPCRRHFVSALQMPRRRPPGMMEAVQPFVDTAISKTVNVPADYPYADFQGPVPGGLARRPEGPGHLSAEHGAGQRARERRRGRRCRRPGQPDDDPLRKRFDGRPLGELDSVTAKIEYSTQEGRKTLYLTVSFIRVEGWPTACR